MRRLGLPVLLAGIGVALFLYLPAPVDSGSSLDKPQPIAAARGAKLGSDTIPAVRGTSGHIEVSQDPASAACASHRRSAVHLADGRFSRITKHNASGGAEDAIADRS